MIRLKKWNSLIAIILIVLVTGITSYSLGFLNSQSNKMDMSQLTIKENRDVLMQNRQILHTELIKQNKYKCCLEIPCSYCLDEDRCDCLNSLMNGKAPCGECIGEILEGKGNKFLAPYFATALADEVGHLEIIQEIISEKYDISLEDQL